MAESIAKLLDHSLLHPTLTDADLRTGCELARRLEVASVCVKPCAVALAREILIGSPVKVGTVIGFPHGGQLTAVKAFEAEQACRQGAVELDMVINVGKALGGDWEYVQADIRAVVEVAHAYRAIVKVIFETDFVTSDSAKIELCEICTRVGAEFVKTSTGFGFVKQPGGGYDYRGATEADVQLMRKHVGPTVQVKAAGGVRTYAVAARMRALGASRIGTTASEAIVAQDRAAGERGD